MANLRYEVGCYHLITLLYSSTDAASQFFQKLTLYSSAFISIENSLQQLSKKSLNGKMVKIVSRFSGMFLVSRLSLQSTPNWLSGFLKDPNTNCTQFLFMMLTIRSFEVTHSGHHSFLRNLPPLLWSESVSKGKNVCRFWLEVCGKDELKKKVIKTKLSFVFGNFFLRFHTSWSSNSEGLLPL